MPSVMLQSDKGNIHIPHFPIDKVGVQSRAHGFTKRSMKKQSKLDLLYLAVRMTDLTTLEGDDTEGKVRQLCAKAQSPVSAYSLSQVEGGEEMRAIPHVAAVCVYPQLVAIAVEALKDSGVEVASVATGFPAGQVPIEVKIKDAQEAVHAGATEIDMVINRAAFLSGRYQVVYDEVAMIRQVCGSQAHLKVILETAELETCDNIRLASFIAMEAGADFIKTSTGKSSSAASMEVTLVMLQAILSYYEETGKKVGMKPAGGIKTAKQAIHYLVMLHEVLGDDWLTPSLFRFGASSLLNDLLRQIFKQVSGDYYYTDIFSMD